MYQAWIVDGSFEEQQRELVFIIQFVKHPTQFMLCHRGYGDHRGYGVMGYGYGLWGYGVMGYGDHD